MENKISEEEQRQLFIKLWQDKETKLECEVPVFCRSVDLVKYNQKEQAITAVEFKTNNWKRALEQVEYKTVQGGRFAKILEYIDRNLHREIRVEELERFLTLPRSKFSAEFHQAFGLPPKQYITLRRIGRAKYLLIRSFEIRNCSFWFGFSSSMMETKASRASRSPSCLP